MRAAALALASLLAFGAGCAYPFAGRGAPFSFVAMEPGLVAEHGLEPVSVSRGVEVVLVNRVILWIPTRPQPVTLAEAVETALRHGNGDVLMNAELERFAWYLPPFYGEEGWRVRGDVARVRGPKRHLGVGEEAEPGALPTPAPHERPAAPTEEP